MSVRYPSHLYIRIDRSLRSALLLAAEEAGQSVSAFARGVLRATLTQRADAAPVARADVAGLTFRGTISQASGDGER